MSRSRRKTLSHTEIENFLFDITPQPLSSSLSPSSSSSTSPHNSSSFNEKENNENREDVKKNDNSKAEDETILLKKNNHEKLNQINEYNLKERIRLIYSVSTFSLPSLISLSNFPKFTITAPLPHPHLHLSPTNWHLTSMPSSKTQTIVFFLQELYLHPLSHIPLTLSLQRKPCSLK
jgi:hypothetical protein